MPNRLFEKDEKLGMFFIVRDEADASCCLVKCQYKDCPREWEIDLEADGQIDKGSRNALVAHAGAHEGKFRRMRRRA